MSEEKAIHLLRGAPAVRSWSKYQTTVPQWTLCGMSRRGRSKNQTPPLATEDAAQVTCRYCRQLMGATATMAHA